MFLLYQQWTHGKYLFTKMANQRKSGLLCKVHEHVATMCNKKSTCFTLFNCDLPAPNNKCNVLPGEQKYCHELFAGYWQSKDISVSGVLVPLNCDQFLLHNSELIIKMFLGTENKNLKEIVLQKTLGLEQAKPFHIFVENNLDLISR